jgi:flagellar biosynthesis repressor protein FlbT
MMYLDPENRDSYYDEFALRMTEFMQVVASSDILATCVVISKEVMRGEHYRALIHAKKLFAYEDERLSYVPEGVSENATDIRESA